MGRGANLDQCGQRDGPVGGGTPLASGRHNRADRRTSVFVAQARNLASMLLRHRIYISHGIGGLQS